MNAAVARTETQSLIEDAAQLGVALSETQATGLLRLLDELAQWNRAYNLTAIRERHAMVHAHLLDSLAAAPELAGHRILDVGTGAGFPGLPLAIAAPERHFTLVDAVGKKIRFVSHVCRQLHLANVEAVHARVEALTPPLVFDTILARAYAGLPALLADIERLAGPETRIVALKGMYPRDELAALPAGWRLEHTGSPRIPGLDATRHLLRLVRVDARAPVVPPRQRLD